MRHMPFAIDQAARDRWVKLMDEAMAEARLPRPVVEVLDAFFRDTATFMINRG
jgi:hemoglobin